MSELKPCPFCGCEPLMWSTTNATAGNGMVIIAACATMKRGFLLPAYINKNSTDSEEKVTKCLIKRWNKRTPEQEDG